MFSTSGGSVGALAPVQPFEFATYRQPGALVAKKTSSLLSTAQSQRNCAIPLGRLAHLRAGKIFQLIAAGIMSTGTAPGFLVVRPFYGPGSTAGATGISLGPSPEQSYTPGLVNVPWRVTGEIVFLSVSLLASSSTVWCTGQFHSGGEGGGLTVPFGSDAPVKIDSKGPISASSGAFNISITFAARLLSGTSISTQYSFVRSL